MYKMININPMVIEFTYLNFLIICVFIFLAGMGVGDVISLMIKKFKPKNGNKNNGVEFFWERTIVK